MHIQKNVFLFLQGESEKIIPSYTFICNCIFTGQLFCFFSCMDTAAVQNMKISDLKITFHVIEHNSLKIHMRRSIFLVTWNAETFMLWVSMHVKRKVWERQKAAVVLFDF